MATELISASDNMTKYSIGFIQSHILLKLLNKLLVLLACILILIVIKTNFRGFIKNEYKCFL